MHFPWINTNLSKKEAHENPSPSRNNHRFWTKACKCEPIYGQIQFNDGIEVDGDQIGAFAWTAAKYNESIGKEPIGNLLKKYTNTEIASVISDFVAAFKECHGQSEASSLLFGKNGTGFYKCVGSG